MSRFKPGQKVTLKKPANWSHKDILTYKPPFAPKFGEVVTVELYPYPSQPDYCAFEEYPQTTSRGRYAFYENDFEPLVSDSVLSRELESVPEHFTI